MEFLPIGKEKIKISLTKEDLETRGLRGEELDYRQEKTRLALGEILREAAEKEGFLPPKNPIFRVFISKEGGCEIFVYGEEATYRYRFPTLRVLLEAVFAIAASGEHGESRAFLCEDGSCLLHLRVPSPTAEEFAMEDHSYIEEEDALPLCGERAIETLSALL